MLIGISAIPNRASYPTVDQQQRYALQAAIAALFVVMTVSTQRHPARDIATAEGDHFQLCPKLAAIAKTVKAILKWLH